jgi:N-methylhydantoinase B
VGGELEVVYLSDGTYTATRGVRGGLGGATARQLKRSSDGELSDELGCYAQVTLQSSETIVSMTCGGGGYGPPTERDPRRVEKDVREGWITADRAKAVYGVVMNETQAVDWEATDRLRETHRHEARRPSSH